MHFNVKKCNVMTISCRKPLDKVYQLNNTIWDRRYQQLYISRSHNLVRANLHLRQEGQLSSMIFTSEPQELLTTAERNRLHPLCTVTHGIWSSIMGPSIKERGTSTIRGCPKKSWIKNSYGWYSSVTDMIEQLGLESLESRHCNQ